MSVKIKYTGIGFKPKTIIADSPADAMRRLSSIPGYINRDADELTGTLGAGIRMRRKKRAEEFAAKRPADGMNPSSSRGGIGESVVLQGFGGLIVKDKIIVGAKVYDMKFSDGKLVGTSGMREETYDVAAIVVDVNRSYPVVR